MPTFVFHAAAKNGALHFQEFSFFHGRRCLLFPFFPSVLLELRIYWINYANARISTGIRPECLGSPGSWTPPPLPVLALQHRRAIVGPG